LIYPRISPEGKKMHGKVYSLTLEEKQELSKFLQENLNSGQIDQHIKIHLILLLHQEERWMLRPVQDYRHLNQLTIPNRYHYLSHRTSYIDFEKPKLFTKLNVMSLHLTQHFSIT